jgi:hypothetical protein
MNGRLLPGLVGVAVGFLAGIVVGGLRPQAEVRRLEAEMERGDGNRDVAGPVGALLRGALRAPGAPASAQAPSSAEQAPEAGGGAGADAPSVPAPSTGGHASPLDAGAKEGLDETRTVLAMRKAAALDALRQEAGASSAQMEQIEAAIDVMNGELVNAMLDVLEEARAEGKEPPRRVMLSAMVDASNALLDADEAIVAALEPAQIAALSEVARDPLAWIDPSVLDVLETFQDEVP